VRIASKKLAIPKTRVSGILQTKFQKKFIAIICNKISKGTFRRAAQKTPSYNNLVNLTMP